MTYSVYIPPQLYWSRVAIVREVSEHDCFLGESDFYVPAERGPFSPSGRGHHEGHREHLHATELWVNTPNLTPSIRAALPADLAPLQPNLVSDLTWNAAVPVRRPLPSPADNASYSRTAAEEASRTVLRTRRTRIR